jgi:TPR repeat protein
VPQNTALGHAWMQRLAKADKMIAGQLAAQIYRKSNGAIDTAYFENLAAAAGITNIMGGGKSKLVLAYMAAKTDAERAKVLEPLRVASKHGDAQASLTLAGVLLEVGGKHEEIFGLVNASMKKDSKDAMPMLLKLAALVDAKDSAAPDILAATKTAAEHGNVEASKTLSMIYSTGSIVPADEKQGRLWLKRAADGGDNDSQYQLGVLLWTTAKGDQDKAEARVYLQKAAASGNTAAQTYLDTVAAVGATN